MTTKVLWNGLTMRLVSNLGSSVNVTYIISARGLDTIEWCLQVSSKVVESRLQEHAELIGI